MAGGNKKNIILILINFFPGQGDNRSQAEESSPSVQPWQGQPLSEEKPKSNWEQVTTWTPPNSWLLAEENGGHLWSTGNQI